MWNRIQKWGRKFEKTLTVLVGSLGLTLLLLNLDFNFLEADLYDLRMARGYQATPDQDIVLVALDDASIKELDEFSPLPLSYHTRFLETLEHFEPKAVGYLVDMHHVSQLSSDMFHNPWGTRFIDSAERMKAKGTAFLMGTPFDVTGETLPPYPLSKIPHSIAVIHKDGNVFSDDKITRRALLTLYDKPAFHFYLAQKLGFLGWDENPPGTFYVPQVDGQYFFFRYHGTTVFDRKNPMRLPYPHYSFVDILKQRIPSSELKNKIILVGTLSPDDSSDFALTPYSKLSFSNPKLLVHANILDSVIHKDGIIRVSSWINWLVTFLVTTTVLWWIMTSTPLYGVFATLALALGFMILSHALFQWKGLWIRESQPLVGIFVSYYLAVPYRLIREYKKRWEYQRKNLILTQVEELKTNFISLVTHDLKTPVARIQGLAEVLLRNPSHSQETLRHIIGSTEELNRFISSILELSKVESNHLRLKLESKDINLLIERSIESLRAQAKAKNISIISNLEPLFPLKLDVSLISKVLNNLVDNALKYSPSGSEITIESKEEGDWIVISVSDQGIGMTPSERDHLFTRFYRAKNDTTTSIPGTGLGLYLTKYFIEVHGGRVEVESEIAKGSTFRIFLPVQTTIQSEPTGIQHWRSDQLKEISHV